MAKKLFGSKSGGRFSGAREGFTREPEQLPEDLLSVFQEEEQTFLNTDSDEFAFPERPGTTKSEDPVEIPEEAMDGIPVLEEFPVEIEDSPAEPEFNENYIEEYAEETPEELPAPSHRDGRKQKKAKKKTSPLKVISILLALVLFIELAYCLVIFTDLIPPIAKLRTIYIETAMSTMRHQWLAKALIPGDIVQEVVDKMNQAQADQVGVNSGWEDVTEAAPDEIKSPASGFSKDAAASMLSLLAQNIGLSNEVDDFFELFHELDEDSVMAWVDAHPEVIANGWNNFLVNEAGINDEGTTMMTNQGDQVLAIDAANGLMVIRITGSTYKGVLVIGKDPSRLKCAPSSRWGAIGERAGEIAEANNGLVAMTGSGFGDAQNVAEGADQAGGAMFSGVAKGRHYPWGYKRVELHLDNRLYITDANSSYSANCTDATEWTPALIVDGRFVVTAGDGYTALNPRACIGQTKDEAIMFLGIEGRNSDSLGCDAIECAEILARYGAYQAMNVDGGTSAIMWYQGEYIMKCSNENLPEGRRLPNAWVYCADTVADPEN